MNGLVRKGRRQRAGGRSKFLCLIWKRYIEKNFKLWAQFFSLPTPDFTTIRQWFLKLGIFELTKSKEQRTDWIFIVDTILERGTKKCFLVLGLSYQKK